MAVNAVVVVSHGNNLDYVQQSASFPISNGGDVSVISGAYGNGAGSFPNNLTPTTNYFGDVVFKTSLPSLWPVALEGMAVGNTIGSATPGSVLFAGSGGVLAQDNANLFWDNTADILTAGVGINLMVNGVAQKAYYAIHTSVGDSWFAANAGNTTLTGGNNTGTGFAVLSSLTSGSGNFALGQSTLQHCTSGNDNTATGNATLFNLTNGNENLAIGAFAAYSSVSGTRNVAMSPFALFALTSGDENVAVGAHSISGITSGNHNTGIGNSAGNNITSGSNNTLIGCWPGPSAAMSNVVALSDGNQNLRADYGYSNSGWTFTGSPKAGAPAAGDLPSGSFSVIDDTSGGATWLVFNKGGTIRKVQLT
jgi:hypothetical protein